MRIDAKTIPSRVSWRLRPDRRVSLDRVNIVEGKYLAIGSGTKQRLLALLRIGIPQEDSGTRLDYTGALRTALQQQRLRGLFEGLNRAALPFLYTMVMNGGEGNKDGRSTLEFDLVVGTWVDGKERDLAETEAILEQRETVLSATLSVALPNASLERLSGDSLHSFVKALLLPRESVLPQNGTPDLVSSLVSFNRQAPAVGQARISPQFYVPNAAESGGDGILLGSARSSGGEFHDFRLTLSDLRGHVAILGMTGSGKSTTGGTIVRQAAALGLPMLVLDWHNEYRSVIEAAGGLVVSPGGDDFSINPIESGGEMEPAEHIAMVSDIFSDIYHFTHPQAYMFRNALQKRLGEASGDEVPTLSGLVKTIEAFPLRSAYDNETKVALLRRLVPLTQGQAGRALGGPSTLSIETLMESVVCLELGHLRDVQTRAVFTDIMLKLVYEHMVRTKDGRGHLTLVEEARNIAPARRLEDPPSVGERMISELRKFGETMVFIAQFPSQVATEVIKNSGTKIVHRVAWPEDVAALGGSMSLSPEQREHLGKLEVGEAIVSVGRLPQPILVQVTPGSEPGLSRRDLSFLAEP